LRIIWSEASLRDLHGIDQFLSNDDPDAAARMLQAIRDKSDQLHDFPASGPALEGELRYLGVRGTPYVLVYRNAPDRIEIFRVRHVREDGRGP
jgi:toxin ParE1/3/4